MSSFRTSIGGVSCRHLVGIGAPLIAARCLIDWLAICDWRVKHTGETWLWVELCATAAVTDNRRVPMTGSGQSIAQSLQLPLATVPLFGHSPTEKHKEESELTRNKGTRRIPIRKTRAAAITAAALRSTNVPSSGVRTDLSPSSYGKMTLILAYVLVMLSRAQSRSVLLDGDDWKVTNANRCEFRMDKHKQTHEKAYAQTRWALFIRVIVVENSCRNE